MTIQLMPSGPKNLAQIFPSVEWPKMDSYYLEAHRDDVHILTTGIFKTGCCCVADKVRVHFLNYLGTWDAINFTPPSIMHQVTSGEFQKGLTYPLAKTDTGIERINVRSNDSYQCKTACYPESAMDWAMEMMDSPKAFIEWTGIQSQADSFLPIKIEDAKFERKKEEDRYTYELVLQFKLSNERINLRS